MSDPAKPRARCPVCGGDVLLVNGKLRAHGFSFGFPRPARARCKGSGQAGSALAQARPLPPGLYVSGNLAKLAQALGQPATVLERLPSDQWFIVTGDGMRQTEDPSRPCRRCRCPALCGGGSGVCECSHDDGEHGPRRSALRRWLRAERSREVSARERAEAADPFNQRALDWFGGPRRALVPLRPEYLAGWYGWGPRVTVERLHPDDGRPFEPQPGHPLDDPFPQPLHPGSLEPRAPRAQDGPAIQANDNRPEETAMLKLSAQDYATLKTKFDTLSSAELAAEDADAGNTAAQAALATAQSAADSASSTLSTANAAVVSAEQDLQAFLATVTPAAPAPAPAPEPAPEPTPAAG